MKKITFLFLFILSVTNSFSQKLPNTPSTYFTDLTNKVDANYSDSINNLLASLEQDFGIQFLVYMTDSLNGENLEDYTNKLFNHWKLGKKGKDNGILLAIFLNDKQFRIEIGYGLEGKIPDLLSNRIQEEYLIPKFKKQKYGIGIYECTKGLYDAATDYKYDLSGEKRRLFLENLILFEKTNILSEYEKKDFLEDRLEYSNFLENQNNFFSYYYIGNETTSDELKKEIIKQWSEILANFPDEENKILYGFSKSAPIYAIYLGESLQPFFNDPLNGNLSNFISGKLFLKNYKDNEFYFLIRNFRDETKNIIEVNSFKSLHPTYSFLVSVFYQKNNLSFCKNYHLNIVLLVLAAISLANIFLTFVLTLLSKEINWNIKPIVWFWSILNILVTPIIVGYVFNFKLLRKVINIRRKKNNWLTDLNKIEQQGYFGNLFAILAKIVKSIEKFLNSNSSDGGDDTGRSYSSSSRGYSSSSSSSSSSRSSSSSSSSSSFGGGGGGRSGGGGSSGRW